MQGLYVDDRSGVEGALNQWRTGVMCLQETRLKSSHMVHGEYLGCEI